jgi:hypothetical protein
LENKRKLRELTKTASSKLKNIEKAGGDSYAEAATMGWD